MKKKIKVIAICLLLVTTILSVASIESEPKGNSVFDNGICKEGENASNYLDGRIVTGFEGNNFGGDLLWYGVHSWKTNNETLNGFQTIFEDVGMEIARFDIYWGKLEPEKGVYNWTLTDTLLSTVDEGIPILLTVFCTSKWGSKYNDYRKEIAEILGVENMSEIYDRPPSAPPINMEDYMDFLDALVNRYKDRVQYWMIDNEVHSAKYYDEYGLPEGFFISKFWIGTKEDYVDLLKNSSVKIKQIDNNAAVLASNFMKHETNEEFTDYILEEGKDYFDILALNLYECPEDDIDRIIEMRSKMNAFGYDRPIWVTEHGEIDIDCHTEQKFKGSLDSPEELKLQSEEIVKRHVLAFSAGVKKLFRLSLTMQNEEWDATGKYEHMSLTFDTAGNERKPGFYTNKMMIEKLKDFNSIETIDYGIYKFSFSARDPVYVLWSDVGKKTVDLSPYLSTSNVKMTYIVTELDSDNNPVYQHDEIVPANSIKVTETPVFIEETSVQINVSITRPKERYLYVFDQKIMPTIFGNAIIIGKITISIDAYSENEIEQVEFCIDGKSQYIDQDEPFEWLWGGFAIGRHEIKVIAYDHAGNSASDDITAWRFF